MARRAPSTSHNTPEGERKAEARRWKIPTVIAALIAALAAISVALIHQRTTSQPNSSDTPHITQVTHGRDSPAIAHVQGPVTVTYGISAETLQTLAAELGVTDAALRSFFTILEQQQVPRQDLDSTLRDIARKHQTLQEHLRSFTSDDPAVLTLKQAASQALEAGDFAQVETLLRQAQERDLHAIQEQQASLKKRQRSAAATSAELGALKNIQLSYVAAATHYRHAAAIVPQEEALTQAEYLNAEGLAWSAAGQYADAQPSLEQALAIREKGLGPDHPDVAYSLNNIAALYYIQGRYVEAEPRYQRALAIREKGLGPDHPHVAASLNNLALLYNVQGRYAEAEPRHQQALAIREKGLGPDHPDVAQSLNNLALLYYVQGRYAEAEPLFTRALAILEKGLGPDHPDVATSLNNLAALYNVQGRYAEAEPRHQQALAIREKGLGPDHPDVAQSLNNLALLYYVQGRYAEAEPLFTRALAILEKGLGPDHPDVATSLNNLAALYNVQGRYAEAEPRHQRALAIREKGLGPDHPDVATSLNTLADLYYVQGRYAEAEPRYQRALAIREKGLGPDHPDVVTVRNNYAALLRATNRDAEATRLEAQGQAHQPPRAWLGVQMKLSTDPPGVFVEQVMAESPAAYAGIQPHDVVIRFNAQEVPDPQTLLRLVGATAIGTTVDVDIIHDGQRHTIRVVLEKRPVSRP